MPRTCAVRGCYNKHKTWSNLIFHAIPTRNPERMKQWLGALNMDPNTPQEAVKKMLVCSEHFSRDYYYEKLEFRTQTMRLFLKDTAIPSLSVTQTVNERSTAASRTCSVVRCDSWRRSALLFKLPEDPERRLEWVQLILEVNGQQLKESSWTDITICNEHFTGDSFEDTGQLKLSAVPTLCVKSEPDESPVSPQNEWQKWASIPIRRQTERTKGNT
ncbi:peroxynitrite isomerase THAP4-like [Epinephelus moara]|uniref:peroxynitrite isomerase THAP4-like n=1 Tax=Epinephelus moara TaxID=300413 RepID=UPI00214E3F47|nr:peroxynitrite isomerase THAP4-like [Epinephelus moara]